MKKTTEHYDRVRELNEKINRKPEPDTPTMPDEKTRLLRAKLILEEAMETIDALGVTVYLDSEDGRWIEYEDLFLDPDAEPDLVEIADGCADISVVTTGTLVACGIPDRNLLELVDNNNLAKFGPGGYLREDGKWIKPPDHEPPDIAGFLEELEDGTS